MQAIDFPAIAVDACQANEDNSRREAFDNALISFIPGDSAFQAEMKELFEPLLSGEMSFEEHRSYIVEWYARNH